MVGAMRQSVPRDQQENKSSPVRLANWPLDLALAIKQRDARAHLPEAHIASRAANTNAPKGLPKPIDWQAGNAQ